MTLRAVPTELDELHAALDRFWRAVDAARQPGPDTKWRLGFSTGVAEIASNVIQYAYADAAPGSLRLRLRLYPDRGEARLTDRGAPFAGGAEPAAELAEHGRGLAITRAVSDGLTYSRSRGGTNRWLLSKRLPS